MDIFEAIDNDSLPEQRELLNATPDMVSITDEDGFTPLHIAATLADVVPVSILLEYGVSLNAQDVLGKTPLHIAAYNGNKSIVIFW